LVAQLRNLERSIAGTDDSALLGQVKLLRIDSNDRLDGLNRSFERFANSMVEANVKALIQALSEIIGDFNAKLNEQFGQNFKDFNLAVGKLIVWQRQYQQQLDSLIEQEVTTRNNLADASLHFAALVDKGSVLTPMAESLRVLLAQSNSQSERLDATLRNLADLVKAAATEIRQLEAKV